MRELGSEMPENLKPEKHIRQLKKEVRAISKKQKKIQKL
jgi:hypothetical protein